jgi:hypothetical protein
MNDNYKSKIFKYLRYSIPILFFKKLKNKFQINREDYILARVACMGKDIIDLLYLDLKVINIQKGRVDLLYNFIRNKELKPKISYLTKFIFRDDIITLIEEQLLFTWEKKMRAPKYIFIDSYSELTDQLFIHNTEKWMFCSNYSDINHSKDFNDRFKTHGLLEINELKEKYQFYFSELRLKFPNSPIFFLHFPTTLDRREKFKERYRVIKKSIEDIKVKYEPFYSISVDENIVDWPEVNADENLYNFPYHFNQSTYRTFATQIKKIISEKENSRN